MTTSCRGCARSGRSCHVVGCGCWLQTAVATTIKTVSDPWTHAIGTEGGGDDACPAGGCGGHWPVLPHLLQRCAARSAPLPRAPCQERKTLLCAFDAGLCCAYTTTPTARIFTWSVMWARLVWCPGIARSGVPLVGSHGTSLAHRRYLFAVWRRFQRGRRMRGEDVDLLEHQRSHSSSSSQTQRCCHR